MMWLMAKIIVRPWEVVVWVQFGVVGDFVGGKKKVLLVLVVLLAGFVIFWRKIWFCLVSRWWKWWKIDESITFLWCCWCFVFFFCGGGGVLWCGGGVVLKMYVLLSVSGQISIIPKPELRGFLGGSLTKPSFKVTSAEVVVICPGVCIW